MRQQMQAVKIFSYAGAALFASLLTSTAPANAQTLNLSVELNFGGQPENGQAGRGWACFFARDNYRGDSFCAWAGESDARLGRAWDNEISSVRIGGNIEVELCIDPNFGECTIYRTSQDDLPLRLDDDASSYRVSWRSVAVAPPSYGTYPPPPPPPSGYAGGYPPVGSAAAVCFYEHSGFQGAGICLGPTAGGSYNFDGYMDNRISSIYVPAGLSVQVCGGGDLKGWCRTYDSSRSTLTGIENDAISSARVY